MEILAMAKEKVQDVGGLMLGCHPRSSDPFVLTVQDLSSRCRLRVQPLLCCVIHGRLAAIVQA
jgi:hypothetical protein